MNSSTATLLPGGHITAAASFLLILPPQVQPLRLPTQRIVHDDSQLKTLPPGSHDFPIFKNQEARILLPVAAQGEAALHAHCIAAQL